MSPGVRRRAWALLLALPCAACAPQAPDAWSVLLVTLDTTRADHLGAYGHPHTATPILDRLASEGVRYARCYAPVPLTLPSHASILTGLLPPRHGVRVNGADALADEAVTLAERLAERGYATGAVVGAFVLDRRFGLAQGFESYDDDLSEGSDPGRFSYAERDARQVTDAALAWLGSARRPFFLWVHYFDPHAPYAPPDGESGGPVREPFGSSYDAEIGFVDTELGRLMGRLAREGRLRETLVVVTADHGEGLWEHGEPTHGLFTYDSTLQVPLIVRFPDRRRAGSVVETPVSGVDLAPGILAWLGFEVPAGLDGRPLPVDDADGEGRALYFENHGPAHAFGWSALSGMVRGDLKWIQAPAPELYDLARDPHEMRDLFAPGDARSHETGETFQRLRASLASEPGLSPRAPQLSDESRERLRALGYAADRNPQAGSASGPDPKRMLDVYQAIEIAKALIERDESGAGVDRLVEAVLPADPGNRRAVTILGSLALEDADVRSRAIEGLWIFARRGSADPELELFARARLARALALEGRDAEAVEAFGLALAIDPERSGLHYDLGRAHQRLGQPERAAASLRRALETARDPAPGWADDARALLAGLESPDRGAP